jgi:hypothetical protein
MEDLSEVRRAIKAELGEAIPVPSLIQLLINNTLLKEDLVLLLAQVQLP